MTATLTEINTALAQFQNLIKPIQTQFVDLIQLSNLISKLDIPTELIILDLFDRLKILNGQELMETNLIQNTNPNYIYDQYSATHANSFVPYTYQELNTELNQITL